MNRVGSAMNITDPPLKFLGSNIFAWFDILGTEVFSCGTYIFSTTKIFTASQFQDEQSNEIRVRVGAVWASSK